jgi:hypothetical protein
MTTPRKMMVPINAGSPSLIGLPSIVTTERGPTLPASPQCDELIFYPIRRRGRPRLAHIDGPQTRVHEI